MTHTKDEELLWVAHIASHACNLEPVQESGSMTLTNASTLSEAPHMQCFIVWFKPKLLSGRQCQHFCTKKMPPVW